MEEPKSIRAGDHSGAAVRGSPGRAQLRSLFLARQILNEIDERGLSVGETLPPEATLARQFGVGRSSLREALRILEVHGFISVKAGAGGGPVVSDPDTSSGFARAATMFLQHGGARIYELVTARVVLEPMLARVAATAGDASQLGELRSLVELGRTIDVKNDREYLRIATAFHHAIGGAAGNQVLNLFARGLLEVFHDRVPGSSVPTSRRVSVIEAHERIGTAIVEGDADAAEALMREHVEAFARDVRQRHRALMDEVIDWR